MKNNLSHQRVDVADVLRGIAVMGIIVLHAIEHFNCYSYPDTTNQCAWLNFTDSAIWDGMFFTFSGKAYAIFALLFGFSFFVQDYNQTARGGDFRLRFCWRLVLLFIIGNINAAFFTGEVLVLYSIVGFVMPLTCRLKDKWLFALACLLMIQPLPLIYVMCSLIDPAFVTPVIPTRSFWEAARTMQTTGDFWQMCLVNLKEGQIASLAWAWDHGRFFQSASLFLMGILVGRRGLFLKENIGLWYKIFAGALIAFFPLYGLGNMLPEYITHPATLEPLKSTINSLSNCAFMLIIVSSVLFAYYNTSLSSLMQKIIPYGRMSLTNYIMQSVIGSMLFYNWGFGLYKHLGITASFVLGIILFFMQLAFCRWWLKSHNHGPLEYLWKRATWLK